MTDDKKASLKSAYELAMERLRQRGGQSAALTSEQKKAIAEVEQKAMAKIAELKIMLATQLTQTGADQEKVEQLKSNHQAETTKIRVKAEEEKERIRQSSHKAAKTEGA